MNTGYKEMQEYIATEIMSTFVNKQTSMVEMNHLAKVATRISKTLLENLNVTSDRKLIYISTRLLCSLLKENSYNGNDLKRQIAIAKQGGKELLEYMRS